MEDFYFKKRKRSESSVSSDETLFEYLNENDNNINNNNNIFELLIEINNKIDIKIDKLYEKTQLKLNQFENKFENNITKLDCNINRIIFEKDDLINNLKIEIIYLQNEIKKLKSNSDKKINDYFC